MYLEGSLRCKACRSTAVRAIGCLGSVPIVSNVAYETVEEAVNAKSGIVDLMSCAACGFVWNIAFDPSLLTFDSRYENDQANSPKFERHVNAAAQSAVTALSHADRIDYLEIGCGQAIFLKAIVRCLGSRLATAEAFDPAWRGGEDLGDTRIRIHADCFGERSAKELRQRPNMIVLRHSLEYFDRPAEILDLIRAIATDNASIFIETPSAGRIIEHRAVVDFAYERPHLFDERCLSLLLSASGWGAVRFERVFSGQYLWAFGGPRGSATDTTKGKIGRQTQVDSLITDYRSYWSRTLKAARERGNVAFWGTGAKGVMFSVLNDPDKGIFDCGLDINPLRVGKFLPVSALPVLSPKQALKRHLQTIYIMNAAYLDEIRSEAAAIGLEASIVASDFT